MHEDFVFDTAGSIGRKLDVFLGAESVHRLDKTDCADRNKILNSHARAFKFFRYVYHKSQIVDYQLFPNAVVSLCDFLHDCLLLLL